MLYSIVLPCFNEQGSVPTLVNRFGEMCQENSDLEVIFVDNGSTDQTGKLLAEGVKKASGIEKNMRIVTIKINRGYGFGILEGLKCAKGNLVGWTHADSQYDPAIILKGFQSLAQNLKTNKLFLLKGKRINRPGFDNFFTHGMALLASLILGVRFGDINAQPKIFPRQILSLLHNAPHDFSLDLFLLYKARKERIGIIDMPVDYGRRVHDTAKGGGALALKWKLTLRTVEFILRLKMIERKNSCK